MTGIVTGMHLFPVTAPLIFGTKLEGILTLVLAAFWAATVSVVANAQTGLAVDPDKGMTIVNGNLYYFVSNNHIYSRYINRIAIHVHTSSPFFSEISFSYSGSFLIMMHYYF